MSTPTDTIPLAYRPAAAAERIGVSRSRLYELIATGEITARKLGSSTLILHDDLTAYLRGLPLAGGPDAA